MSFTIEFYEKENKEVPFDNFLSVLPNDLIAKVFRDLELLETFGNKLREPYSAPIGDGIFELRTKQGSNIARSLYFFMVGERIIVTHGFIKKQQKTPLNEIEKAKKYRADWLRRNK